MKKEKTCKLAQFIKDECIIKAQFAKKIGVSGPSLISFLKGERFPPLEIAYNIEKATKGFVKMQDWIE